MDKKCSEKRKRNDQRISKQHADRVKHDGDSADDRRSIDKILHRSDVEPYHNRQEHIVNAADLERDQGSPIPEGMGETADGTSILIPFVNEDCLAAVLEKQQENAGNIDDPFTGFWILGLYDPKKQKKQ